MQDATGNYTNTGDLYVQNNIASVLESNSRILILTPIEDVGLVSDPVYQSIQSQEQNLPCNAGWFQPFVSIGTPPHANISNCLNQHGGDSTSNASDNLCSVQARSQRQTHPSCNSGSTSSSGYAAIQSARGFVIRHSSTESTCSSRNNPEQLIAQNNAEINQRLYSVDDSEYELIRPPERERRQNGYSVPQLRKVCKRRVIPILVYSIVFVLVQIIVIYLTSVHLEGRQKEVIAEKVKKEINKYETETETSHKTGDTETNKTSQFCVPCLELLHYGINHVEDDRVYFENDNCCFRTNSDLLSFIMEKIEWGNSTKQDAKIHYMQYPKPAMHLVGSFNLTERNFHWRNEASAFHGLKLTRDSAKVVIQNTGNYFLYASLRFDSSCRHHLRRPPYSIFNRKAERRGLQRLEHFIETTETNAHGVHVTAWNTKGVIYLTEGDHVYIHVNLTACDSITLEKDSHIFGLFQV